MVEDTANVAGKPGIDGDIPIEPGALEASDGKKEAERAAELAAELASHTPPNETVDPSHAPETLTEAPVVVPPSIGERLFNQSGEHKTEPPATVEGGLLEASTFFDPSAGVGAGNPNPSDTTPDAGLESKGAGNPNPSDTTPDAGLESNLPPEVLPPTAFPSDKPTDKPTAIPAPQAVDKPTDDGQKQDNTEGNTQRRGGGSPVSALGVLAGGLVAAATAVVKAPVNVAKSVNSLVAPRVKAKLANNAKIKVADYQFSQANHFLDMADAERGNLNARNTSINNRIEAMKEGKTFLDGLSDYSNNVAKDTGVSRGAARQSAVERIHDLSDTSDPVINGLRELSEKIAADPVISQESRAAQRALARMERAGTHAGEAFKAGLDNTPDGAKKREIAHAFEEKADVVANKGVTDAHLSKPGSKGKERLEEASKAVKESMEALAEKIKEMVASILRAFGIGKKP